MKLDIPNQPLLLGLSGGPDSIALLHLLIQNGAVFQVAHIDHGWREESAHEAALLKKKVELLGLKWHEKRIKMEKASENEARKHRLKFFKEVIEQENLEGLLLAHQKDDVIETSLKRVLEGAHLSFLGGMRTVSTLDEIKIYRPLLSVSKSELLECLNANGISYFVDQTNYEERFLRGRMRTKILPSLSRDFGKEVGENLYQLSMRANEWRSYLDQKVEPIWRMRKTGPLGVYVETNELEERIEIRHLIQKMCGSLPRDSLEQVTEWVLEKRSGMGMKWGIWNLRFEFGKLFFFRDIPHFEWKGLIREGEWKVGLWTVYCEKGSGPEGNWSDFFEGRGVWTLPEGEYSLSLPRSGERVGSKRLNKWYSDWNVPSFLRTTFPVLSSNDGLVKEFLTGQRTEGKLRLSLSLMGLFQTVSNR